MTRLRISDAARFLGVSDDTVRRWVADGRLSQLKDASNRAVVEGSELAALAQSSAGALPDPSGVVSSSRNRFAGLVTDVSIDGVMAQVSMQWSFPRGVADVGRSLSPARARAGEPCDRLREGDDGLDRHRPRFLKFSQYFRH